MDINTFENSQSIISQPIVSQSVVSETDTSINKYILYIFFIIVVICILYYLYFYHKNKVTDLFKTWYTQTSFFINSYLYPHTIVSGDNIVKVNQNTSPTQLQSQPIENTIPKPDISASQPLNKALDKNTVVPKTNYTPDNSHSGTSIQKTTSKHGWCKIGETNGVNSCIEVGPNDECMSGQIFPTRNICVNPKLRA